MFGQLNVVELRPHRCLCRGLVIRNNRKGTSHTTLTPEYHSFIYLNEDVPQVLQCFLDLLHPGIVKRDERQDRCWCRSPLIRFG